MKIVLATDGGPVSRKMLAYVASNSMWFRREYTYVLLHVAPPSAVHADPEGHHARTILNEGADFLLHQIGFDPIKIARIGKAAEIIPDFARRHECNMIVMGSHGHSRLESLVLGSVTQGVLTNSHVPVLVVR